MAQWLKMKLSMLLLLALPLFVTLAAASNGPCSSLSPASSPMRLWEDCPELSTLRDLIRGVPGSYSSNYTRNNAYVKWVLRCPDDCTQMPNRTLFLPTNAAWAAYFDAYQTSKADLLKPENRIKLFDLIRGHSVGKHYPVGLFKPGRTLKLTTLVWGPNTPVVLLATRMFYDPALSLDTGLTTATTLATDIQAGESIVVHIIDSVLVYPAEKTP